MGRKCFLMFYVIRKGLCYLLDVLSLAVLMSFVMFLFHMRGPVPFWHQPWFVITICFIISFAVSWMTTFILTFVLSRFAKIYYFFYHDAYPKFSARQKEMMNHVLKRLDEDEIKHLMQMVFLIGDSLNNALTMLKEEVTFEQGGVVVFSHKYRYKIGTNDNGIITSIKVLANVDKIKNYDEIISQTDTYTV